MLVEGRDTETPKIKRKSQNARTSEETLNVMQDKCRRRYASVSFLFQFISFYFFIEWMNPPQLVKLFFMQKRPSCSNTGGYIAFPSNRR